MQINGIHIKCKEYFEQEIQSAIARNELADFLGVLDRLARHTENDGRVLLFSDFSDHGFIANVQESTVVGDTGWYDTMTIGIIHDPEHDERTWGFHT